MSRVTEGRNPAVVSGSHVAHALFWGLLASALVIAGIVVGSRGAVQEVPVAAAAGRWA